MMNITGMKARYIFNLSDCKEFDGRFIIGVSYIIDGKISSYEFTVSDIIQVGGSKDLFELEVEQLLEKVSDRTSLEYNCINNSHIATPIVRFVAPAWYLIERIYQFLDRTKPRENLYLTGQLVEKTKYVSRSEDDDE